MSETGNIGTHMDDPRASFRQRKSPMGASSNPDHKARFRLGYGKAFGSFGEIVQGRLSNGDDFLVTLPIDLWSTCELACTQINGPLVIDCDLEKSRAVLYLVLEELGVHRGYHIACNFTRNIPVGKGLSSSTADMLAALRAIQEVFGFLLEERFVSRIFATIEPHDALHYNASAAYNHRRGQLIQDFNYIPAYTIIAVDNGGVLDTLQYNQGVSFSESQTRQYDRLFARLQHAFETRDDRLIAECATESARMHARARGSQFLQKAVDLIEKVASLGIVATHSGTCAGFLFPYSFGSEEIRRSVAEIEAHFDKEIFVTCTLKLLV